VGKEEVVAKNLEYIERINVIISKLEILLNAMAEDKALVTLLSTKLQLTMFLTRRD